MRENRTEHVNSDFSALLLSSLDLRWEKYRKELRRCQKSCSETAVHDLRVATRRVISTLRIVETVLQDENLNKVRQNLRRRFKEFGPLRDVQVQRLRVEKLRSRWPEIEPFFTLLLMRERKMVRTVERKIRAIRIGTVDHQIRLLKDRVRRSFDDPSMNRVGMTAAVGSLAAAFARTTGLLEKVHSSDPDSIHRVRVSFKRFRYTAEAMQGTLLWVTPGMLKAMNRYQNAMGAIQDIEVFNRDLKRYLAKSKTRSRISCLPLLQELSREHRRLVDEFMGVSDQLYGFWKEAAGRPAEGTTLSSAV